MSLDPSTKAQLLELIAVERDGELLEEQTRQLRQLVVDDADAAWFYLRAMHLQSALCWKQIQPNLADATRIGPAPDIRSFLASASSSLSPTQEGSENELLVSTENILSMLEEEAEIAQRVAAEQARIESLAAEKFAAFQQERERNRRPGPVAAPRNAFYATVSSLAAAIFFILWMLPDPVPVEPVPVVVASIHDSIDARWSDPSISTAPGTQIFTLGNLALTRGVVEIAFDGGARGRTFLERILDTSAE